MPGSVSAAGPVGSRPSLARTARLVAAWVVALLIVSGCYQSFGGPNLDRAPAEVRDRPELPSCGRTVSGYVVAGSDPDAASCFWEAYENGEPAEYVTFFYSDAGESTWIYRLERDGRIIVFGLRPGGWVRMECDTLGSTAGDPNISGPGFIPEDCTERTLAPS